MQPVQRISASAIGIGYLDKFHGEKYAASEKADRGRIAAVGVAA